MQNGHTQAMSLVCKNPCALYKMTAMLPDSKAIKTKTIFQVL